MVNALTVIVNITYCYCEACCGRPRQSQNPVVAFCEICCNKKAFRSLLLWKAFNTRDIAFSGQLELLRNNYDNRNV